MSLTLTEAKAFGPSRAARRVRNVSRGGRERLIDVADHMQLNAAVGGLRCIEQDLPVLVELVRAEEARNQLRKAQLAAVDAVCAKVAQLPPGERRNAFARRSAALRSAAMDDTLSAAELTALIALEAELGVA